MDEKSVLVFDRKFAKLIGWMVNKPQVDSKVAKYHSMQKSKNRPPIIGKNCTEKMVVNKIHSI